MKKMCIYTLFEVLLKENNKTKGKKMRISVISVILTAICWTLATLFTIGVLLAPVVAVAYVIGG